MKTPTTLTPEDLLTLRIIRAQIAIHKVFATVVLAYGVYDYCQHPNPLGPMIYGFFAWLAYATRPILPDGIRAKLETPPDLP